MIEDATQEPAPGDIPLTPEIAQDAPPAKNKGGRPFAKIDWELVERMLRSGCSGIDIADALNIDKVTLYDRYIKDFPEKEDRFEDWKRQCQASTRQLLRQGQLKSALGYTYEKVESEYKIVDGKQIEVKRKTSTMKVPENPALLIFLGKNMLGQSDAPEGSDTGFGNIPNYQLVGDDEEESDLPALPSGNEPDDDDLDDLDDDTNDEDDD